MLLDGARPVIAETSAHTGSGIVTGMLADAKDKPVAEMPLRLYVVEARSIERSPKQQTTQLAEKLVTTAKSDAHGKFRFPDVKPGAYLLRGSKKNVGFVYQEVDVKSGQTTDLGTIKLTKP